MFTNNDDAINIAKAIRAGQVGESLVTIGGVLIIVSAISLFLLKEGN